MQVAYIGTPYHVEQKRDSNRLARNAPNSRQWHTCNSTVERMRWILSRGIAPSSFDRTNVLKEGSVTTHGLTILTSTQSVPETVVPWLYLRLENDGKTLTSNSTGPTKVAPVISQDLGQGLYLVNVFPLELRLVVAVRPWHQPIEWPQLNAVEGDYFLVSAFGWHNGSWCDGPLARVHSGAFVSNYLPTGGAAALIVSTEPGASPPPLEPWTSTQELEGTTGERIHRCLLGQMQSALDLLPTPDTTGWLCRINKWSPATAVELVLACQATAGVPLAAMPNPELGAPPPAWRRLCQNLGVKFVSKPTPLVAFDLPGLAPLASAAQLDPLQDALNRLSDVIPRSLR